MPLLQTVARWSWFDPYKCSDLFIISLTSLSFCQTVNFFVAAYCCQTMVEPNEINLAPKLSSDSPGVQITTVKLNGANHFLWPRVVKVILGAR